MLDGGDTDLLARRAERSPAVTALEDARTGESWTYAALDSAVDRTARRLAGLGVTAGSHVGMLLADPVPAARVVFAGVRLGAPVVALNARHTPRELGDAVERADVEWLVCEADTERAARECWDGPVTTVDDPAERATALADVAPADVRGDGLAPDDTQLLLFTSGTTGAPKPVRLTPRNLRASAVGSALRLGVERGDRWYSPLAPCHVGGLAPILRATLYGTTAVVARGFDAADAVSHLESCTAVSLVPTMLSRVLDAEGGPAALAALRFVLLGGAPAPADLLERCADAGVPACPTYGLTEAASQVTTARPGEAIEYPGTVGRPLFDTEVAILDDEGDPLPAGERGEIAVAGPTVSPGYYGEVSAEFGPHGLRTGDVGYLEDGRLWVLNRREDRIVTGGENVDPGEVAAVLRSHPGVEAVAVVGVSDPEWGEQVGALVVPAEGPLDADALRDHCRDRLAGYKLPRVVAFVDALPRTASGTVDRDAARERLRAARDDAGES